MQIKKSVLGPDFFAWNVFLRLKSLYLLKKRMLPVTERSSLSYWMKVLIALGKRERLSLPKIANIL